MDSANTWVVRTMYLGSISSCSSLVLSVCVVSAHQSYGDIVCLYAQRGPSKSLEEMAFGVTHVIKQLRQTAIVAGRRRGRLQQQALIGCGPHTDCFHHSRRTIRDSRTRFRQGRQG